MDIDWSQILSDLVFPALVATLATFGGYAASYQLNKKQRNEEQKIKRSDFLSNLQNEFTQISVVLSKLQEDIADNNFFSIKTLSTASPSYLRLRQLRDEVTIITDQDNRSEINDAIGNTVLLLEDIDALERFLLDQTDKHENKREDLRKELRAMRVQLFGQGMYLDDKNQIKFLDEDENKEKGKQLTSGKKVGVEQIFQDLVNDLNDSQNKLDQTYQDTNRRRLLFTTRIVDTQAKVRDAQNLINKLITNE